MRLFHPEPNVARNFTRLRHEMVERQILARDVRDPAVIDAMREVPREEFVPEQLKRFAYEDSPLPIGQGQTISQPYMVAFMVEALRLAPGGRVLEIGTGSGYAAAILSRIASDVFTIEIVEELAKSAGPRLRKLGYNNIQVKQGDGTMGWPEHSPYDGILVSAGAPDVPEPLVEQLAVGGMLVIPVGHTLHLQSLLRIHRVTEIEYRQEDLGPVQFVPLVGVEGWHR